MLCWTLFSQIASWLAVSLLAAGLMAASRTLLNAGEGQA
jgi:hypothetical protein